MGVSFGNYLSGAASALTNAAGGNQAGIAAGNQLNQSNMMDALQLYRQQAQDQLAKQTQQANLAKIGADTSEANARASALLAPPVKPKESYMVPGVGLGHYEDQPDGSRKFVVDQAEPTPSVKLGPGENDYNPDGSLKVKGPSPTQSFTPVTTSPVGSPPVVQAFGTHTGTLGPPLANAKTTGAGGGGQGAQTSVADLIAKDKAMTQLEPGLIASKSLTPFKEAESATAQGASYQGAHGATSPLAGIGQFLGQQAGTNLGATDPNAQRYIELGTNFGDEASNAFKGRMNEASAARKIALSRIQAQNAANPGVVTDTQEKRRNIIGMAILSHPEQQASLDPATVAYYTGNLSPQERQEAQASAGVSPATSTPPTGAGTFSFGGRTYKVP